MRQVRIAGVLWRVPDDFDVLETIAPRIAEAAKTLPVPALEAIARMWIEGYEHALERVAERQSGERP
jgi:hypothetical protein